MGWVGPAFALLVFALGASIGSFLNVVIYRLPHGQSLSRPSSRCPACGTAIKARHNVPVLGWLVLRGRCAACSVPISARYPMVELAVGLLAVAIFHRLTGGPVSPTVLGSEAFFVHVLPAFAAHLAFAAALVAVVFIDLDLFVIPNEISLPFVPLGLLASWGVGHTLGITWQDALIGAVAGGGFLLAVSVGYYWATGRDGMGGGDVKLLAMLGAWLGWQALPAILLVSSVLGLVVAVVLQRSFAVEEIPPDPLEASDVGAAPSRGGEASADGEPSEASAGLGQLAVPFGPFLGLAGLVLLVLHDLVMPFFEEAFTLSP